MLKPLFKFAGRIYDTIEELIADVIDDPELQASLEADLSLPPGGLNAVKTTFPPATTPINQYVLSAKPSEEERAAAIEAAKAFMRFLKTIIDAAKAQDPLVEADEVLYRLLELATVDLVKFETPTLYAWMRLLGVLQQDLRLTVEEAFAPEVPASIFTGDYYATWKAVFLRNYERFRLDQDLPPEPAPGGPPPSIVNRQLGVELYLLSDIGFGVMMYLGSKLGKIEGARVDQYYGWELPPRPLPAPCAPLPAGPVLPPSEHIASRASTLRIADGAGRSALLTQLLLRDAQNELAWLLSLRGRVELEQVMEAERPIRFKLGVTANAGLDAVVGGSKGFELLGDPNGSVDFVIEPVETSNRAPVISYPDPTGTRFEIGEYSVKGELSKTGFSFRAEARKSALVIVGSDGDGLTGEALPSGETRIDFDFALVADSQGIRFEGGGRLGTTLSLNKEYGRVKVQTIEIALAPKPTEGGSQLRFLATAGMSFDLGPVKVSMDGVGATLALGAIRGAPPPDAVPLLGPLLHFTKLGFEAPKGVGIAVKSDAINGGGYLFHDEESGAYGGVLQLSLGKRWTLTAVGLLNTRLPDGSKAFSLLAIASLELDPPFPLFLGIALRGFGLLIGIHRTLNPDALRSGLRNKTLDAILFPQDPIANAPRIISALKAVFPPARDRHLFGLTLSLTFGRTQAVVADLGVIYEFGAKRWVVLGQIHAAFPPKAEKKFLELNVDAVGIWDPDRGEFSLDASLYDSRIAWVTFSGDVAVRVRKGDSSVFLFSAGGYHPEFAVPPGFPSLQRVKISLADSKALKLLLTGYIAITSNTRQIGAKLELKLTLGSFGLEAILSFDALWEPDVRFLVDFDVEVKLKWKGTTFFGVDVSGRFTGPEPKRVVGEWSIDLWLTSISDDFDCTFGEDRPPLALPAVDPLPPLVAALKDVRNWSATPPGATLVSLRKRDGLFVHPLGRLSVRQQVLPLGIRIDRFSGAELASGQRYDITQATVGNRTQTAPPPEHDQFAAGEFLNLSDDEKIARPSFESMAAGVTLTPIGVSFGPAVDSPMKHDETIFGPDGEPASGTPGTVGGPLVLVAAKFGAAANSALQERFAVAGPDLQVGPERFVAARVEDLAVTGPATSYTAALQAIAGDPELQVVVS